MNNYCKKKKWNKGDVSVLFTFIIVMVIALGFMVITNISISTLKNLGATNKSVQAFYAADTGIERGMFDFSWAAAENNSGVACGASGLTMPIAPDVSYKLYVDDGSGELGVGCPEIYNASSICIQAEGVDGSSYRKLQNAVGVCPAGR
jgi:hypothetical protein